MIDQIDQIEVARNPVPTAGIDWASTDTPSPWLVPAASSWSGSGSPTPRQDCATW